MKLFLSVSSTPNMDVIAKISSPGCLNILCSYEYREGMCNYHPKDCKMFMADSGDFTAMNAGKPIDEAYINNYINWINQEDIQNFIEMDLDEIIGYEKTLKLREKIERETGKKPIPCWHLERGEQGWKDMCDNYQYVAISLSRMTNTSKWLVKHKFEPLNFFLTEARRRGTKVHALGCNDLNILKKYHFYSADSSTHTLGGRYGRVMHFDGEKIVNINTRRTKKIDRHRADAQNIKTMIEVMKYAEEKL